jgi:ribosome-associated protein
MIEITKHISLNPTEIKFSFIASPGPGGQNVNKVATAVQLRFDVLHSSSLSDDVRARLVALLGKRITSNGELIITANRHRTQNRNKQDAIDRLCQLIHRASIPPKKRKKTKPTLASKKRRLDTKKLHGKKKALRRIGE